jgi:LPXTG-motif cell wall-anchored protein
MIATRNYTMKKMLTGTTLAAACVFALSGVASAEPEIVVPIDNISAGPVGSTVVVGTAAVAPEFQGVECIATAIVRNQESQHPNNDLIITSGSNTVVIPDVESIAFETSEFQLPIVLSESVSVALRFGSDGFFSGGIDVQFDCAQDLPSSSDVPPTTVAPSTTGAQPAPTDPPPGPTDPNATTVPPVSPTTAGPGPGPVTTLPGSGTPNPEDVLPATGSDSSTVYVAFGLTVVGVGALLVSRRAPRSS